MRTYHSAFQAFTFNQIVSVATCALVQREDVLQIFALEMSLRVHFIVHNRVRQSLLHDLPLVDLLINCTSAARNGKSSALRLRKLRTIKIDKSKQIFAVHLSKFEPSLACRWQDSSLDQRAQVCWHQSNLVPRLQPCLTARK